MIHRNPPLVDITVDDIVTPEYVKYMLSEARDTGAESTLLINFKLREYHDPYFYPEGIHYSDRAAQQRYDMELLHSEAFIDFVTAYLQERFEDVYYRLRNAIDEDGDVEIFRGMRVPMDWPERVVQYGGHVGICWSMDVGCTRSYDTASFEGSGAILKKHDWVLGIVLHAYVPEEYIDWVDTFWHQMHPDYGDEEKEIRLFRGTPLSVENACLSLNDVSSSRVAAEVLTGELSDRTRTYLINLLDWWSPDKDRVLKWCLSPIWRERIQKKVLYA